jgi:3-phenylpropionate/cinnamic acid dioxygenase small subunit
VDDAGRVREPTTFADWNAINTLLMTYAEHLDAGRFDDVAAMFEHSTYRIEHADGAHVSNYEGAAPVRAFCEQTRIYPDGTPRTKHVISNVIIDVDGDRAGARCYATVFQQTDVLSLQPIASGRYVDQFERIDGTWRFADRLVTGFLLGDRSQHVAWHDGTPHDEAVQRPI